MTARKFKITCITQITFLLNNKYLSNEGNHHRYPFHYLILILIACNFGIQVRDMGSIPSEVLSMVNSSQLMYHIYYTCHPSESTEVKKMELLLFIWMSG